MRIRVITGIAAPMQNLDGQGSSAGGTTAPAHILHDIVRKLPDGAQVELDSAADDGRLNVRGF